MGSPSSIPAAITGPLSIGSRGEDVRAVQFVLNRILRPASPLGTDGIFGVMTERAVRVFQKSKDLVTDGIVGPLTARALGFGYTARPQPSQPADAHGTPQLGPGVTPQSYLLHPVVQSLRAMLAACDAELDAVATTQRGPAHQARATLHTARSQALTLLLVGSLPGTPAATAAFHVYLSLTLMVPALATAAAQLATAGIDSTAFFRRMGSIGGLPDSASSLVRRALSGESGRPLRAARNQLSHLLAPLRSE